MTNEIPQYRSAVTDAVGRVIPDDGDLRVWLDDDVVEREAPEGWTHLITAREVCFLLITGRVVELSLDHDLSDDQRYGKGVQVIDFLDDQQGQHGRSLWPRNGITLHTGNSHGRDSMSRAIRERAGEYFEVMVSYTSTTKPHFDFRART